MKMIYDSREECLIDYIKFWKVILSTKISANSTVFSNLKPSESDCDIAKHEIKRLKKELKDIRMKRIKT